MKLSILIVVGLIVVGVSARAPSSFARDPSTAVAPAPTRTAAPATAVPGALPPKVGANRAPRQTGRGPGRAPQQRGDRLAAGNAKLPGPGGRLGAGRGCQDRGAARRAGKARAAFGRFAQRHALELGAGPDSDRDVSLLGGGVAGAV